MNLSVKIEGPFFQGSNRFLSTPGGLGKLTSIFLSNAIVLAGITFVILVIIAGFSMISGAGNQNPALFKRGTDILTAAVIGLIIVFASYWIVSILQSSLSVNILK
jgi:hypothetical protein